MGRPSARFASLFRAASAPPWVWLGDWFRSEPSARAAARRAALAFAQRLLEVNTHRIVGDFDERITESRRGVEGALGRTLRDIVATAERAAERARETRAQGEAAVASALTTLDARAARLAAIARTGPEAAAPPSP